MPGSSAGDLTCRGPAGLWRRCGLRCDLFQPPVEAPNSLRYSEPAAIRGRNKNAWAARKRVSGGNPLMTPAGNRERPSPIFRRTELRRKKLWPVAGVDEVGRGPLAGPVCAAAVILDPDNIPDGLNDSKAMSPKAREMAFARIVESALATSFACVTAAEIDATDIRKASAKGDGASGRGALRRARLCVGRWPRSAPGPSLSRLRDRQGRRQIAVDRRRLDRGQGGARRSDAAPGGEISGLWVRDQCGLWLAASSRRARRSRSNPLPPHELLSLATGTSHPIRSRSCPTTNW